MYRKFKDVIDAFGLTQYAKAAGITEKTAAQQRWRDSIPSEYWPSIVRAAQRKNIEGVTFERLAKLQLGKKRSRRAKPVRPSASVPRDGVAA